MNTTVDVDFNRATHTPSAFVWRGRRYCVSAVQERWRLVGAWWNGEGEKTFFRVVADTGGIFRICYDHADHSWMLERVED